MVPNQTPTTVQFLVMTNPKKSPWDTKADKYAKSAYETGKTVLQIITELSNKGYTAGWVKVYDSLSK